MKSESRDTARPGGAANAVERGAPDSFALAGGGCCAATAPAARRAERMWWPREMCQNVAPLDAALLVAARRVPPPLTTYPDAQRTWMPALKSLSAQGHSPSNPRTR